MIPGIFGYWIELLQSKCMYYITSKLKFLSMNFFP